MRVFLLLSATVVIGTAAACTVCTFTDITGNVLSTCTANHRLHCAGEDKISSGEDPYDNVACSGTEWYGFTCDGKVSLLGASVNVSCPSNCGTTCASVLPTDPSQAPIDACFDNKAMKSCASGDMTIETDSGSKTYSKAVCMGDNNWIAFNCDGAVKKIAGPLKSSCAPPAPTTPPVKACTKCTKDMMTFGGGFIDMGITTGANGCLKWLIQCDAVALGAVTFWEYTAEGGPGTIDWGTGAGMRVGVPLNCTDDGLGWLNNQVATKLLDVQCRERQSD